MINIVKEITFKGICVIQDRKNSQSHLLNHPAGKPSTTQRRKQKTLLNIFTKPGEERISNLINVMYAGSGT